MPDRQPLSAQAESQRQNAARTNDVHLVAKTHLAAHGLHFFLGHAIQTCDFEFLSYNMSNLERRVRHADGVTTIAPTTVPLLRPHIIATDRSNHENHR